MNSHECPNWLSALVEDGYAVTSSFIPLDLTARLSAEVRSLHRQGALTRAGIGREDDHQFDRQIRRDRTRWLHPGHTPDADYLTQMERLRLLLNETLFLGLFEYEAHWAVYEPGAFYARHADAFRGARNRVLSTVFYMNDDWHPGDGGELAIYREETDPAPVIVIAPEAGTLVMFLSEDIPHEVRPARRARYSIAGWFRVHPGPENLPLA